MDLNIKLNIYLPGSNYRRISIKVFKTLYMLSALKNNFIASDSAEVSFSGVHT